MAVSRANQKTYQFGRQVITTIPFAVVAWSKAVILGRQPVDAELPPSSGQAEILVLPLWHLILTFVFARSGLFCFCLL